MSPGSPWFIYSLPVGRTRDSLWLWTSTWSGDRLIEFVGSDTNSRYLMPGWNWVVGHLSGVGKKSHAFVVRSIASKKRVEWLKAHERKILEQPLTNANTSLIWPKTARCYFLILSPVALWERISKHTSWYTPSNLICTVMRLMKNQPKFSWLKGT